MVAHQFRREDSIEQAAMTGEAVARQIDAWSAGKIIPPDAMKDILRGL
jgi:hypothetical protein